MRRAPVNYAVTRAARRVPGLRRLPAARLLALGEIALIARDHLARLQPYERRRLLQLVRRGRGRKRNLSPREQDELAELIAKMDPRLFVGTAAQKLAPFPLPKRVVRGPRRR